MKGRSSSAPIQALELRRRYHTTHSAKTTGDVTVMSDAPWTRGAFPLIRIVPSRRRYRLSRARLRRSRNLDTRRVAQIFHTTAATIKRTPATTPTVPILKMEIPATSRAAGVIQQNTGTSNSTAALITADPAMMTTRRKWLIRTSRLSLGNSKSKADESNVCLSRHFHEYSQATHAPVKADPSVVVADLIAWAGTRYTLARMGVMQTRGRVLHFQGQKLPALRICQIPGTVLTSFTLYRLGSKTPLTTNSNSSFFELRLRMFSTVTSLKPCSRNSAA